jgi:hypothetical protein
MLEEVSILLSQFRFRWKEIKTSISCPQTNELLNVWEGDIENWKNPFDK